MLFPHQTSLFSIDDVELTGQHLRFPGFAFELYTKKTFEELFGQLVMGYPNILAELPYFPMAEILVWQRSVFSESIRELNIGHILSIWHAREVVLSLQHSLVCSPVGLSHCLKPITNLLRKCSHEV